MDTEQTPRILDLLHTMQEACQILYTSAQAGQLEQFRRLSSDTHTGLNTVVQLIKDVDTVGNKKLLPACQSVLSALMRVKSLFSTNIHICLQKIEFELLPLLQEAYAAYYFFQYLTEHPEKLPDFYAKDKNWLYGNPYIDDSVRTGNYKYEVSILVLAYNKLEYTRRCVESLLANLPAGLHYELILVNHGSSDGTEEYFEHISPHKQLNIAVNGGGVNAMYRIVEGEFTILVSNDVIVTPGAIENLLACIRSDPRIAWVVPATPNVSNLQTIPAQYSTEEELLAFARNNNHSDPFRREQRVRLCNPIDIVRSSVYCGSAGLCLNGYYHTMHPIHAISFPDDRCSLLLRRNGYKLVLAKDAYCHHFGSVTLRDEIKQQNEQKYYLEGRREFYKAFGVDPWGTGFCFDPVFMERVVGEDHAHADILGINCGLGSNSLKIKEQLKEYCHNTDVTLYNVISGRQFKQDLEGISDHVQVTRTLREFKSFAAQRRFSYIIWEDLIFPDTSVRVLLRIMKNILRPGGQLFIKRNGQFDAPPAEGSNWSALGGNWHVYRKAEERSDG